MSAGGEGRTNIKIRTMSLLLSTEEATHADRLRGHYGLTMFVDGCRPTPWLWTITITIINKKKT